MSYDRERRRLEIFRRSPESKSTQGRSHDSSPPYNYHGSSTPEPELVDEHARDIAMILIPLILSYIGYSNGGIIGTSVGIISGLAIDFWLA